MHRATGFTVLELLVALGLLAVLIAGLLLVAHSGPDVFAAQGEVSDMHQRLRVAIDAIARDLVSASAVRPYRSEGLAADPPGTFRTDTITAIGAAATTTYWLKSDDRLDLHQLMSYSGGASPVGNDVPVADNVVGLSFEYFGNANPPLPTNLVPLAAAELTDGPWRPDDGNAARWDADLLRVRTIAVTLRVQAAAAALRGPAGVLFAHAGTATSVRRWAPDVEIRFQVAPRNLNLAR